MQVDAFAIRLRARSPWEAADLGVRLCQREWRSVYRCYWVVALPVFALCHHGMRSAQVVAFLLRQGHAAVYNLTGGIDAWSTQVDPRVPRY